MSMCDTERIKHYKFSIPIVKGKTGKATYRRYIDIFHI